MVKAIAAAAEKFGTSNAGAGEDHGRVCFGQSHRPVACRSWACCGHRRYALAPADLARICGQPRVYYNDAGAQINNLALSVQFRCRELGATRARFRKAVIAANTSSTSRAAIAKKTGRRERGQALDQVRQFAVAALRLAGSGPQSVRRFVRQLFSGVLALQRRPGGKNRRCPFAKRPRSRTAARCGCAPPRLVTTRPRDAEIRRHHLFLPDVAYHVTKWQRGFTRAITELGADHHGSLMRVKAGLRAMNMGHCAGLPGLRAAPDDHCHARRRGSEDLQTRGSYVTLRELIDEVGRDAYALLFCHAQIRFAIDVRHRSGALAFRRQPGLLRAICHARICSVLAQWGGDVASLMDADLSR